MLTSPLHGRLLSGLNMHRFYAYFCKLNQKMYLFLLSDTLKVVLISLINLKKLYFTSLIEIKGFRLQDSEVFTLGPH